MNYHGGLWEPYLWKDARRDLKRSYDAADQLQCLLKLVKSGKSVPQSAARKLHPHEIYPGPQTQGIGGTLSDLRQAQPIASLIEKHLPGGRDEWLRMSWELVGAGQSLSGEDGIDLVHRLVESTLASAATAKRAIRKAIRNRPSDGRGRPYGTEKQFLFMLAQLWKHHAGKWPSRTPGGPFHRFARICFDPMRSAPETGGWLEADLNWLYNRVRDPKVIWNRNS